MPSNSQLQQAITDITAIRRVLERADDPDARSAIETSAPLHVMLHVLGMALAALLLGMDLLSDRGQSQALLFSAVDTEFMRLSLVQGGISLAAIVCGIYLIAWRGAKRAGEGFDSYVARNARYLRRLTLVSDLTVKFICLAIVIVAKRPDLTPPMLFVFMADWLVNGKFWVLPGRTSIAGAVACFVAAAAQIYFDSPLVIWPAAGFLVLSAASLVCIRAQVQMARKAGHDG